MREEEYEVLLFTIDNLREDVERNDIWQDHERLLDSAAFEELMSICKPTAQAWRDEGLISFSQIGHKIYYRIKDIEVFLRKHRHSVTKKERKR